jgi:ribonuclease D
MAVYLHSNDLPDSLDLGPSVAVDTETLGLNPHRDRLCLIQLSAGDGNAHLVQFPQGSFSKAKNLKTLLQNKKVLKIFHFARFDLAAIETYLDVVCAPVYCTKIAAKMTRTYTEKNGLKELCKELLGFELSKQQQASDWGQATLTEEQKNYAAGDVLHLHAIKAKLDVLLEREGRTALAEACFDFLPTRAKLDLMGWADPDIFEH